MPTDSIAPSIEAYIRSDTPTTTYSTLIGGAVSGKTSQEYRPLLSFDASASDVNAQNLAKAELEIEVSNALASGTTNIDKVLDAFTSSATWNTSDGVSAWSIVGTGGTFSADGFGTDFSSDVSASLTTTGVKTIDVTDIVRDALENESGIVRLGFFMPSIVGINDTLQFVDEGSSPGNGARLNLSGYTKTPLRRTGRVSARV